MTQLHPDRTASDAMTPEEELELREWVITRPASIQEVMRQLPPGCTVRGTVPLGIPAPGCVGQVVSYLEPGGDGRTGVRVSGRWNGNGPFMDAHCNADELELVEEGIATRDLIDSFLQDNGNTPPCPQGGMSRRKEDANP